MTRITSLAPDWDKTYPSKEALEKDLQIKFGGPGFYLTDNSTMLIVPVPLEGSTRDDIWHVGQAYGTQYRVFCSNAPFHKTLYSAMNVVAPTKHDGRTRRLT